jgi:hypothetical protein
MFGIRDNLSEKLLKNNILAKVVSKASTLEKFDQFLVETLIKESDLYSFNERLIVMVIASTNEVMNASGTRMICEQWLKCIKKIPAT